MIPISKDNILDEDKTASNFKRKLDDPEFHDFHIYFDYVNLYNDIEKFKLDQNAKTIFTNAIKKAIATLESLLKVVETSNTVWSDESIKKMGIESWNESCPCLGNSYSKGMQSLQIDLIIFGKLDDTMDDSTLASGDSYFVDRNKRPLTGVIKYNSKIDFSNKNMERYLTTITLHEFTHILGFEQFYIANVFNFLKQYYDEEKNLHSLITSPKVVEVGKKYFNCPTLEGVELNSYSDPYILHWNGRFLLGEYMAKLLYTEEEVISEFTLAYLEDTKFYKANYYTGGLMRYGKGKGCEFLSLYCVDKSTKKVNPKFGNEYFDTFRKSQIGEVTHDPGCSSGRQSRAYHYYDILSEINNMNYLYYGNAKAGYINAEYCPVSKVISEELNENYYSGHCSSLGEDGKYGSKILYYNGTESGSGIRIYTPSFTNKMLAPFTGETYSDHSFCYLSSLFNNGIIFKEIEIRGVCYNSFCSERSLTINIFDVYFVCPRAGGNIKVQGYNGTFSCPDYYLICSGTVLCNDMYDCVAKKSEIKEESYNYDYTPLTTQNITNLGENIDDKNNYELSDNGKCPKYCKLCKEGRICIICKEDCYFLASKTSEEVGCLPKNEVSEAYYKEDSNPNVYYKCAENCASCKNNLKCDKCLDGYAYKEEDRSACYSINTLESYYTKDQGLSYYPCDKGCLKCYYLNGDRCYLSEKNYYILVDTGACWSEEHLNSLQRNNPGIYVFINETHLNYCYNVIKLCYKCEDANTCKECDSYTVTDFDGKIICKDMHDFDDDEIFLSDDYHHMYPCNNSKFHNIPHCKKCSNKISCNMCQDGYTFINGNKKECVEIKTLEDKYIQDPSDKSNYVLCSNFYDNCMSCDNDKCLKCNEDFIFLNDDHSKCFHEDSGSMPVISKDEALKVSSISLSYEQINNFNYNINDKKITFDLFTLTTVGEMKAGDKVKVYVNLIYKNGIMDVESTESICTANNVEEQSGSARVQFLCTIENLKGDYYSLRYNSSDSICGIPKDEMALDPVLTKKYKNNEETKIPPIFTYESIDHSLCSSKGILTIVGKISEKLSDVKKINIPLTYPEGIELECEFNDNQDRLECKTDRDINNKIIIIEQTVLSLGNDKYLNLKSIKTEEKITCSNAVLQDLYLKQGAAISFRQVSHLKKNSNGFSFIFVGLTTEEMNKGNKIKINVNINKESEDREIDCTLENDVNPPNNQMQANFLCSIDKDSNDFWKNLNYDNISISISPNNKIGGVTDLDEASADPAQTDEKIKNTKISGALINIIDYYEYTVGINVLSLESIDVTNCDTTGQLTITGSFSSNLEEQINFNLNLTYPNTELKCELNKVNRNTLTSIKCITQEKIISIQDILIESKLTKKKDIELFLIKGKSFTFDEKKACENYDTVRQNLLEKRMNSGISFSLMSSLEVVDKALKFNMAFSRESNDIPFDLFYLFYMSLSLSNRRNLRTLEENTISEVPINCTLNENLILDSIAGYDCNSKKGEIQGNILSFGIDNIDDMPISGIDNVNMQGANKFNVSFDFSDINILKEINNLPYINITTINGESCVNNGQYIIYGYISNVSVVEEKYSNIKILLSSSKSEGVCELEINKDNSTIKMVCQNSDKFSFSNIIIENSIIYDSEGKMICKINKFNSPEKFACDISIFNLYTKSINAPTSEQTNTPTSEETIKPNDKETDKPTSKETIKPNDKESNTPTSEETIKPNDKETDKPTSKETIKPNDKETDKPTSKETIKPNDKETDKPTSKETIKPNDKETNIPTSKETIKPNDGDTNTPTSEETIKPNDKETDKPTSKETIKPNDKETDTPTSEETNKPTSDQTNKPNDEQTNKTNDEQTNKPNDEQINKPNDEQTNKPNDEPSNKPNDEQTNKPYDHPSNRPNDEPSNKPNDEPSNKPNVEPSNKSSVDQVTNNPNDEPSNKPNVEPTNNHNAEPTNNSSIISTNKPILGPSDMNNLEPSKNSNVEQTKEINFEPTNDQIGELSNKPIIIPTDQPIDKPSNPTIKPTNKPIVESSDNPIVQPTNKPDIEITNKTNDEQNNIPDITQNTTEIPTKENIESNSTTVPSTNNSESDSIPNNTITKIDEMPAIFDNESTPFILLGFSHFRMYDTNFLFYIYLSSISNNRFSQTITFPIIITYNTNIRLLKETQGNCTLQETKSEGKYQYLCEVYEDTKNIKQIKIEPDFNFGTKGNFSLKGISPIASMFMDNIQSVDDKFDIISDSAVYIMDNSSYNKYDKYSFNISGEINDPQPKLENRNLTIMVNVESNETKTMKEIECIINNITRKSYSLNCTANETFENDFQSAMSFIDDDDILLINFATTTTNDSNISNINYGKYKNSYIHFRTNNGSLGAGSIIGLIVALAAVLIITILIIVYLRKKSKKFRSAEESTIVSIKKPEDTKNI